MGGQKGSWAMHKYITHACAAVAAGAVLGTLGVTAASASGAAFTAVRTASVHAPATSGTQLWVARYSGPNPGQATSNTATSVATSRDGNTVFITGYSYGGASGFDYVTAAYNATTGKQLWLTRYKGADNSTDEAKQVAVSPSGKQVFVTGWRQNPSTLGQEYATVAYNAATGAQQWAQSYRGGGDSVYGANGVAVSPSGGTVYATGSIVPKNGSEEMATVAYNANTGKQLWASIATAGEGTSVAVSPTTGTVYVTGNSTIAYNPATGAKLWAKHYASGDANSVAVSSTGGTVVATGTPNGAFGTVAYKATTGAQLWFKHYGTGIAYSVAISPSGGTAVVTGGTDGDSGSYATVAYNTTTGAQIWAKRYGGITGTYGPGIAYSVALSPSGGSVYVTGARLGATTNTYATVAYNTTTGVQLWAKQYHGTGAENAASSVAVSPTSGTVYVTGASQSFTLGLDYATVAYSG